MKDCLILTLKDGKNFGGNAEEGEMCSNACKGMLGGSEQRSPER